MDTADAVGLDATDNVATALRAISAGETVSVRIGAELRKASVGEAISFGHKFALSAIPSGTPILKYGCAIGHSTCPIPSGAHVHTHNLISSRARPVQGQADDQRAEGASPLLNQRKRAL